MMATMTTTTMMMVMDQFKDLGVVLCRPSRMISKVIAYANMEVSCVLQREYYMEYYCHQLHNEFFFPRGSSNSYDTKKFVQAVYEAHLYTYITLVQVNL